MSYHSWGNPGVSGDIALGVAPATSKDRESGTSRIPGTYGPDWCESMEIPDYLRGGRAPFCMRWFFWPFSLTVVGNCIWIVRQPTWFLTPISEPGHSSISSGPKRLPPDPSSRLSSCRPFRSLGFSEVARGLLLVIDRFPLDPLIEVRRCAEIMSASHPSAMAPDTRAESSDVKGQDEAGGNAIKTITGRIVKAMICFSLENKEVSSLTCWREQLTSASMRARK